MPSTEPVRYLFDSFVTGGLPYLKDVVQEGMQESLHLDFKRVANDEAPLGKDDRKTLASALSGFANSDGGVIVWGVDCRSHGSRDPDTAKDLKPIRNVRRLLSDLNSYSAQLVSPGVVGVEHALILDPSEEDTGFAVSYVPRSEVDLHMAVGADQHRYYYRANASFLAMEAYMVADRFGRRPRPQLSVDFEFVEIQQTINAVATDFRYRVSITNVGKGLALYPAVTFSSPHIHPWNYGIDGNGQTGLPLRPRTHRGSSYAVYVFAGGLDHAIYPGTTLDVTHMVLRLARDTRITEDIAVSYGVYCEGYSAQGVFSITPNEVRRHRGF